ncbi:MAG: HAD family hydrolase [Oscillospiraceae bacterium]|nr:HAD family hydrolase [Oscillospiraceae bacterium]
MYDFDKTLSPRDMQEYAFIPSIKMTPEAFWAECDKMMRENRMDQILAYMYVMFRKAKGKLLFTRDTLRALGRDVELFEGVESWFRRINVYAAKRGMKAEHYIISSGLKEIIEGTRIAENFEQIYAAEYCYDDNGEPCWPAMAVNYTSKTQFLFRINKGVLDVTENDGLNEFMEEDKRRVPFRNMIYIGDGLTDVPCMKLVRANGGHSIAVYQSSKDKVNELLLQGRVDYVLKADYSEGGEMEKAVFAVIDQAAAASLTADMHVRSMEQAQSEAREKLVRELERSFDKLKIKENSEEKQ